MNGRNVELVTLAKPDYLTSNERGATTSIYCKVCGAPIAVSHSGHLRRLKNYAEIKIQFADGTKHITNICRGCVPKIRRNEDALMAIYHADIAHMMQTGAHLEILLEGKLNPRITQVDTSQKGIV